MPPPTSGAPPSTTGLRLRLTSLALLASLPALVLAGIMVARDGTSWVGVIGLAVVGVLVLIVAWILGTVLVVGPVSSALRGDQDAVRHLQEVDRMRTDFVSMISHDLRNPLATIRGFGQLLRDRPQSLSDDQRHQAADVIVRQVDRMAGLVDNVLDVSRLESDGFTYAFVPYDPRGLIEESAQEARASWPRHRIVVEAGAAIPGAKGDSDRLKRAILNLISNACRFSAEGTSVTMRAARVGPNLRVDVIDRGEGIPREAAGLLFERFARLRTPDTQKVRGAGLGLYISRRIVEAHGGRIWFESEPGSGSHFSIELPLDPPGPGA